MIRVLECFAGIGACSKALTNLGIEHEIVDAVEIDRFAVASFNAIHGTSFAPQDICEWDKEVGEIDLLTHGSPCQDFSLAGLGKGGDEGSGTRSALLYETLRIVEKVKPKVVIWENVKGVLSKKHRHNFEAYQARMESLGYTNYYQVLNSKDFGVPQNRERVFTVSILDGREFHFPEPQPLTVRLKDILESVVDERYYLSDEKIASMKVRTELMIAKGHGFRYEPEGDICQAILSRDYKDPKCVQVADLNYYNYDKMNRVYSSEGLAPVLETMGGGCREPKIIDPQGRTKKVCVPRDYAPTLRAQTHGNEPLVVASCGRGENNEQQLGPRKDGITNTLTSVQKDNMALEPSLRVRKLVPLECWRLMGFGDEDFEKAAKANSNTQLYKQVGNSIVVTVLEAILRNLF